MGFCLGRGSLIALAILIAVIVFLLQSQSIYAQQIDPGSLFREALELAYRLQKLGGEGIDISRLADKLNSVLVAIDSCGPQDIECLLSARETLEELREEVESLEREAPSIVMWRNIELGARIALLALAPVAFYIGFPRLYSWWWFRSRRGWIVRRYNPEEAEEK